MGAWASTQLGDWQDPKLQDLRSVSKQRGPKELEEKQRTKTENYRARAGAMRDRRHGHTDSVGLGRAGTEVIRGSRDEEGRNRGKQGPTVANTGNVRPNLHLGSFGKRYSSEPYLQRFQDSRLGRRSRRPKKDNHHSKRRIRQTDAPDRRTEQAEMWRTPHHKSLQRRWGQAQPVGSTEEPLAPGGCSEPKVKGS